MKTSREKQPTKLSADDKFRLVDSSDPMVQQLETNWELRQALMLQLNQKFPKSQKTPSTTSSTTDPAVA